MNLGVEDEYTEFKRSTSELREGVASVAAMLNKHRRALLYFGVRDDGEVVGQDVAQTTLRQVSQAIANSRSLRQMRRQQAGNWQLADNKDLAANIADKLADKPGLAANIADKLADKPGLAANIADIAPLSSSELYALYVLLDRRAIKSAQVAQILNIPLRTARYALTRLVDKGVVESSGANRNRTYHLRGATEKAAGVS